MAFARTFQKSDKAGRDTRTPLYPRIPTYQTISLGMWLCPASGLWTRHVGAVKEPSASDPPVADVVWFEGSSG
ncbi:hypothetical protein A9F13_04g01573 [Clavispora lusitaniae]|uniref:Uncharacterized protein n=1 Tax=Clavispora lusitaniae TaxID=36911 RepID=A0AA91Q2W4_CLALS|nr:hypothetical protein A9F13_04g01573 [Clavispora lusitaniae]